MHRLCLYGKNLVDTGNLFFNALSVNALLQIHAMSLGRETQPARG